ncbi:hypothetical protein BCEN4_980015 [Burkholderia cenocepacia]|nr:hypothetical protein BCEN4_980015 [Burkholderia cenocepacia]
MPAKRLRIIGERVCFWPRYDRRRVCAKTREVLRPDKRSGPESVAGIHSAQETINPAPVIPLPIRPL